MIEERGSVTDLAVKIGVSCQTDKRLKEMQVGNPRILRLATKLGPFSEKEAYATEAKLHKCFKRFHVRGEWFDAECLSRMDLLEAYEEHQRAMRTKNKKSAKRRKRERK